MKLPRMFNKALSALALAFSVALLPAPKAFAQASYTGTTYTQNFDILANNGSGVAFTDNSTISGWYLENYETNFAPTASNPPSEFGVSLLFAGTRQSQSDSYTAGTGSSNTGAVYSFGVAGTNAVTDRALGYVGSGTPDELFIGVAVQNNSGAPLAGFTVTYDGEQWRLGGNTAQRPETVIAFYRVGGTAFDASGTWTAIPALNFTSPNVSASTTGSALDGNAPANRTAGITATVNVPVQTGEIVWILWADADHAGSDHGMAIDNFSFAGVSATAGAPVISSLTTATGVANANFNYTITASGSPTSYNATGLPAWLSVNTSTGVLSGTPPAPGTFPVTISATNGSGTGSAVLTITVAPDPLAPVVQTGQVITNLVNTPLTYQVIASNSPTAYTCGTLPAGLTFDTATGIISGTPTTATTFNNVAVSATNARGTGTGTINVVIVSAPVFSGDSVISAYAGTTGFSQALTFSQNPAPFSYTFEGLAATGLENLSQSTISGTVTSTPGTYNISVTATNDYGSTTVPFTLVVLDAAAQSAIPLNVVINKFSNSDPDRVELLVLGNLTPGSTVDMRGMILKDFSNSIVDDNGGRAVFNNTPLWAAVPAGTLIVFSSGNTAVEDLDASDFVIRVNRGNTTYFTTSGTFDIATTEMIMIKAANTGTGGIAGGIHAFSAGSTTAARYVAFTGPKIGTTTTIPFGTNGAGVYVNNANSSLSDYTGTGATGNTPIANLTFGAENNTTNGTFIASLRTAPPSTNANLSALSLSGVTLSPSFDPAVTNYSATVANTVSNVTLFATVQQVNAVAKFSSITIPPGGLGIPVNLGANSINVTVTAQDGVTTKTYFINLTRLNTPLTIWRDTYFTPAGSSTSTTGPGADANDFDGDGVVNLIEYVAGTDPTVATANPVVSGTTTLGADTVLTLTYPRHPTDSSLAYSVLGSTDLTTGFGVTTGNTTISGSNATYTDNVPLNATNPRRFLRLQVGPAPAP